MFIAIHGGNKAAARLATMAGWSYGARADYTLYARPYMLDYDWQAHCTRHWTRYLSLLDYARPHQGVAMDYERPGQRAAMLARIRHVQARGVVPVVVPKFAHAVVDIPDDCIIGISVPTRYAGYLPPASDVRGRRLHLLGGHPDQWVYLREYYSGSVVVSIDTNVFVEQARTYGKFWSRHGRYRDLRRQGYATNALIVASMRNAVRYWESGRQPSLSAVRVVKCRAALGLLPVQLTLWDVA